MARQKQKLIANLRLESRPATDLDIPAAMIQKIGLFRELKKPPTPSLDSLPGSWKLRFFTKDEVICSAGEPGWTAFYLLTRDDLRVLRGYPALRLKLIAEEREKAEAAVQNATGSAKEQEKQQELIAKLTEEAEPLPLAQIGVNDRIPEPSSFGDPKPALVSIRLPPAAPTQAARDSSGFLGLFSSKPPRKPPPSFIPIDAPRDLNYKTREVALEEGSLFGEMSCLFRSPRSATVVALQDCFVFEFFRNVFDSFNKDPAYKQKTEVLARQRLVSSTLPQTRLFAGLPKEDLEKVAAHLEFLEYAPGDLIFDQHQHSDSFFLIASGIVKIVENVSWLLPPAHPEAADGTPSNEQLQHPSFRKDPSYAAAIQKLNLGLKVWELMALPSRCALEEMAASNRLLLTASYGFGFPTWQPEATAPNLDPWFKPEQIPDWKAVAGKMVPAAAASATAQYVWQSLSPETQKHLTAAKTGPFATEQIAVVLADLNDLLSREPLPLAEAFSRFLIEINPLVKGQQAPAIKKYQEFLADCKGWTWGEYQRWNRAANRLMAEEVWPALQGRPKPSGPAVVNIYLARGDCFGEMGLMENKPRNASCLAQGHPSDDPERAVGQVQLFRMKAEAFQQLLETVPGLRPRMQAILEERRQARKQRLQSRPNVLVQPPFLSPLAEQLGAIQGQRLMLIDLDRCTRCDECVQACVNTHDDGKSRLYLTGPRLDRFLVPMTCRSCLDPVCMIGCPVGSIHRGDNKQMVIEDWCIGCGICANQCPYGSIEMSDTGIIAEESAGWRFRSAGQISEEELKNRSLDDSGWATGRGPFIWNRDLVGKLGGAEAKSPLLFRREFSVPAYLLKVGGEFEVEIASPDPAARLWINGLEVKTDNKVRQNRRTFSLVQGTSVHLTEKNVVVVWVHAVPGSAEPFFDLRLDPIRQPELTNVELKQVTEIAVVCDMCSSLKTGPACVRACPHEAAFRVDFREVIASGF